MTLLPKEIMTYCLLIIYFLAAYKPIMPVAADLLAHTFWEANHLESVHHQHGSHHLQTEISRAEKQEDQNNLLIKFSEPGPLHLFTEIIYTFKQSVNLPSYISLVTSDLYHINIDCNYPPPKFC